MYANKLFEYRNFSYAYILVTHQSCRTREGIEKSFLIAHILNFYSLLHLLWDF